MAGFVPVETVLIEYLSEQFEDARVCTETPSNLQDVLPVIQVERIGGSDHTYVFDVARVDVDVFAASRGEARQISEEIRSLLRFDLPGKTTTSDAVVADVVTTAGPSRAPYDDSALRRFVATYEVTVHCNPL